MEYMIKYLLSSLFLLLLFQPLLAGDRSPFDLVSPSDPSYYDLEDIYERGYLDEEDTKPLARQEPLSRYMMAFYVERAKARMQKASEHPGIVVPFVRVTRSDEEKIERLVSEYRVELRLIAKKYANLRKYRDEMVALVDKLEKNVDEMEEDFVEANLTDQKVMVKGHVDFGTSVSESFRQPIEYGVAGASEITGRGFGMSRGFRINVISQSTEKCRFEIGSILKFTPNATGFRGGGVYGAKWFGPPSTVCYKIQFEEEDFDLDFSAGKNVYIRISPLVFQPNLNVSEDWTMGRTERFGQWADRQIQGVRLEFERLPRQMKGLFGIGRIGSAGDRRLINSGGRLEVPISKHLFAFNYGYTGEDLRNRFGTRFMNLTTSVSDIARVDTYFKLSTEVAMSVVDTGYHFDFLTWEQDAFSGAWSWEPLQEYDKPYQNPAVRGFAYNIRADRRIEIGDWQMPFSLEYFDIDRDFISEHGAVSSSTYSIRPANTAGGGDNVFSIPVNLASGRLTYYPPQTNIGELDSYVSNQRGIQSAAKIKGLGNGTLDIVYKLSREIDAPTEGAILGAFRLLRADFQRVATGDDSGDAGFAGVGTRAIGFEYYDPEYGGPRPDRLWSSHLRLSYVYSVNKLPIFREFIRTKRTFFRVVWYNASLDTTPMPDFNEMCAMRRFTMRYEGFIQLSAALSVALGYSSELIESFYVRRMWLNSFGSGDDPIYWDAAGHAPKYTTRKVWRLFFGWDMPGGVRLVSAYNRIVDEYGTHLSVGRINGSHWLSVNAGIGF